MTTEDEKDPKDQQGKAEGEEGSPPEKKPEGSEPQTTEPETVPVTKVDLLAMQQAMVDNENYKKERAINSEKVEELEAKIEELSTKPLEPDLESEIPLEEQQHIIRDLKRQEKNVLAKNKEYQELTSKQRKEFNEEFAVRKARLLKSAVKNNELIADVELETELSKTMRFVKQETTNEEIEKARLQGQADILNREAGQLGSTSSVRHESPAISEEAYRAADVSLLVKTGQKSREEMAKFIQKRIDEGKL